jgi:hypothetical protein
MQAYKVKGKIDETGHLIITEAIELAPGDVEVIVLRLPATERMTTSSHSLSESVKQVNCEIPGLKQWLEQSPPVPPDFNPEQAKWESLREKHNL